MLKNAITKKNIYKTFEQATNRSIVTRVFVSLGEWYARRRKKGLKINVRIIIKMKLVSNNS